MAVHKDIHALPGAAKGEANIFSSFAATAFAQSVFGDRGNAATCGYPLKTQPPLVGASYSIPHSGTMRGKFTSLNAK